MRLSCLLTTAVYGATTDRHRRDTTCPTDWTLDATQTICSPSGGDFSVSCSQDGVTINFNGNHIYENSKDWIVDTTGTIDQSTQEFATFEQSGGSSCSSAGVTTMHHQGSGVFSFFVSWQGHAGCGYDTIHAPGQLEYVGYLTGSQGIASAVDGDGDDLHLGTAFRFPVSCVFQDSVSDVQFTANTRRGTFETGHDNQVEGLDPSNVAVSFTLAASQTISGITSPISSSSPALIGQPVLFEFTPQSVPFGSQYFIDSCTAYPDATTDTVSYPIIQVRREISFRCGDHHFRTAFAFHLSLMVLLLITMVMVE